MADLVETEAYPAEGVGLPDGTAPAPVGQVPSGPIFTLTDLAELAVRLKSINSFDRRGYVVYFDDFEDNPNKWRLYPSGHGQTFTLSTAQAKSGACSGKLTLVAGDGTWEQIQHYLPLPVHTRIGVEISFSLAAPLTGFMFHIYMDDGTYINRPTLWYSVADKQLFYYNSLGVAILLMDNLVLQAPDFVFNTIKLVFDYSTRQYIRVICNEREVTLDGISYWSQASLGPPPGLATWFDGHKLLADAAHLYFDDFIVTQQEPENIR